MIYIKLGFTMEKSNGKTTDFEGLIHSKKLKIVNINFVSYFEISLILIF